jgi:hypothetical protein
MIKAGTIPAFIILLQNSKATNSGDFYFDTHTGSFIIFRTAFFVIGFYK